MKNVWTGIVMAFFVVGSVFALLPSFASAASLTSSQVQAIVSLLSSFGADTAVIANVQASLGGQPTITVSDVTLSTLTQTLSLGMTNDQVANLQRYLAQHPNIYPEGKVSGYFGPLTEKAVKKFQEENGLEPVGIVGPKTRTLINSDVSSGGGGGIASQPNESMGMTPSSGLTPTNVVTNQGAKLTGNTAPPATPSPGDHVGPRISYLSITPTSVVPGGQVVFTATADDPSGVNNLIYNIKYPGTTYTLRPNCNFNLAPHGTCTLPQSIDGGIKPTVLGSYVIQSVSVSDGAGNLATYYPDGTVTNGPSVSHNFAIPAITVSSSVSTGGGGGGGGGGGSPPPPPSPPPLPAPVIFNIQSTASTTQTTVTWTTDESCSSVLVYSTAHISATSSVIYVTGTSDITFLLHTALLTSLATTTTYYYQLACTNGSGITSTSSEQSFTTLTPPPVIITNIQSVASTTQATVTWTTDIPSSSMVAYSTQNAATTSLLYATGGGSSTTAHTVLLSSLASQTTYYYQVVSALGSGATATSSGLSFTTLTLPPPGASWTNLRITHLLDAGAGGDTQNSNFSLASSGSTFGVVYIAHLASASADNVYFDVLDANGNRITQQDVQVSTSGGVFRPRVVWTGSEYGIFWEDHVSHVLQFARFATSGNRIANNKSIAPSASNAYVSAVWNGGGYGISWTNPEGTLYFERIDTTGDVVGSSIVVSGGVLTSNFQSPSIAWTGGEYGLVWGANATRQIYFARIDTNGVVQGSNIQISNCASVSCSYPSIYWNGNSYNVLFQDTQTYTAYLAAVMSSGSVQSTTMLTSNYSENLELAWSGSEYGFIWAQVSGSDRSILNFARIDAAGATITQPANVIDQLTPPSQLYYVSYPEIVYSGTKYAVIWHDSRDNASAFSNGFGDIYFATGN